MRIRILSDLHCEFGDFQSESVLCDLVILAGDIAPGKKGLEWIRQSFPPPTPVVYVPGNHEYYGKAIPKLRNELLSQEVAENVHVLDEGKVEYDGISVLGCTLWTDFELLGNPRREMIAAREQMNDYKRIRVSPQYRRLNPGDTFALHMTARQWLQERINSGETRNSIIVTHHAPSGLSLPTHLVGTPIASAYASNLESLVEQSEAHLWVHGHTHHCVDYYIGKTRIISNPRGYVGEQSAGFSPSLTIEIA
ncbi:MAG: metallophosphoesterase [Bacteroidota bacterium]